MSCEQDLQALTRLVQDPNRRKTLSTCIEMMTKHFGSARTVDFHALYLRVTGLIIQSALRRTHPKVADSFTLAKSTLLDGEYGSISPDHPLTVALLDYTRAYEHVLGRVGFDVSAHVLWQEYLSILNNLRAIYRSVNDLRLLPFIVSVMNGLAKIPLASTAFLKQYRDIAADTSVTVVDYKAYTQLFRTALDVTVASGAEQGVHPPSAGQDAPQPPQPPPQYAQQGRPLGHALQPARQAPRVKTPAQAYRVFVELFQTEDQLARALELPSRVAGHRLLYLFECALYTVGGHLPAIYVDIAMRTAQLTVSSDVFVDLFKRKATGVVGPGEPAVKEFADSTDLAFAIMQRGLARHPSCAAQYLFLSDFLRARRHHDIADAPMAFFFERVLGQAQGSAYLGGCLHLLLYIGRIRSVAAMVDSLRMLCRSGGAAHGADPAFWAGVVRIIHALAGERGVEQYCIETPLIECADATTADPVVAGGPDRPAACQPLFSFLLQEYGRDARLVGLCWECCTDILRECYLCEAGDLHPGCGSPVFALLYGGYASLSLDALDAYCTARPEAPGPAYADVLLAALHACHSEPVLPQGGSAGLQAAKRHQALFHAAAMVLHAESCGLRRGLVAWKDGDLGDDALLSGYLAAPGVRMPLYRSVRALLAPPPFLEILLLMHSAATAALEPCPGHRLLALYRYAKRRERTYTFTIVADSLAARAQQAGAGTSPGVGLAAGAAKVAKPAGARTYVDTSQALLQASQTAKLTVSVPGALLCAAGLCAEPPADEPVHFRLVASLEDASPSDSLGGYSASHPTSGAYLLHAPYPGDCARTSDFLVSGASPLFPGLHRFAVSSTHDGCSPITNRWLQSAHTRTPESVTVTPGDVSCVRFHYGIDTAPLLASMPLAQQSIRSLQAAIFSTPVTSRAALERGLVSLRQFIRFDPRQDRDARGAAGALAAGKAASDVAPHEAPENTTYSYKGIALPYSRQDRVAALMHMHLPPTTPLIVAGLISRLMPAMMESPKEFVVDWKNARMDPIRLIADVLAFPLIEGATLPSTSVLRTDWTQLEGILTLEDSVRTVETDGIISGRLYGDA